LAWNFEFSGLTLGKTAKNYILHTFKKYNNLHFTMPRFKKRTQENKGGSKGGQRGQLPSPPPWPKKKERGERKEGRKKEK